MNVFVLTEKATGERLVRLQMSPLDSLALANVLQLHVVIADDAAESGQLSEAELQGIETLAETINALRKAAYQCSH